MLNILGQPAAVDTKPRTADPTCSGPFDAGGGRGEDTAKRKRALFSHKKKLYSTLSNCTAILLLILQIQETVIFFATSLDSDPNLSNNINSNSFVSHNHKSAATGFSQRHSGHYSLAELCPKNSVIYGNKKIDGSVISLKGLHDKNCTFTLQTRQPTQYFTVRFEELQLSCSEKLKLIDADTDYGQPSIKDYSCRDNMANASPFKTTSSFLTVKYSPGFQSKPLDGFRFVVTAVYADTCPLDAALCRTDFCISKSLFCDGINHCMDASDELSCQHSSSSGFLDSSGPTSWFGGGQSRNPYGELSPTSSDANLSNALMMLVILVLIIFACVIIFISAIYCRRDRYPAGSSAAHQHHTSHYAQYQHQLAQARGPAVEAMPLHQSSSVMFANPAAFSPLHHQHAQQLQQQHPNQAQLLHHPQYQAAYFQASPTHMLATATLDRRLWNPNHAMQATPTRLVQYHPGAVASSGATPTQLISLTTGPTSSATSNQLAAAYQNAAAAASMRHPQQLTVSATSQSNGAMTTQHTIHASPSSSQQIHHNNSNSNNNNSNNGATNGINKNNNNSQASF